MSPFQAPMPFRALIGEVDIADVSHFVHPDTPMDHEAAARGTTVYLVDKRIDMLPALLGTNLCSLRPHVERLAFSVIWVSRHRRNSYFTSGVLKLPLIGTVS